MSQLLIDKMRKAREGTKTIGGLTFTLRRPTEMQVVNHTQAYKLGREARIDLVFRSVVDWDIKESDLVTGGAPDKIPFDQALFSEWLSDKSEYWQPLTEKLFEMIEGFNSKKEKSEKN